MYYNTEDKSQFLRSELNGLRKARDGALATNYLIRQTWAREDADLTRDAAIHEEYRDSSAYAARERFRVSHREAAKLKDEVAALEYDLDDKGDEYGDLDEYGYAA